LYNHATAPGFQKVFDITLLVYTEPKILTGFSLSLSPCRGQIKEGPLSSWRNREKRLKIVRNMWCTVYRSQEGGGRGEAPHSSVPPEIGPGPEQQGTTPLLITLPLPVYWV
jgi:hypothetical protein